MAEAREFARAAWGRGAPTLAVIAVAMISAVTSCLSRRDGDALPKGNECAACHGDSSRSGDALLQAAPPRDLSGAASSA